MIRGDKLSSTLFRCHAIHKFVYEVLVFYPRLYIGAMLSTTLYMLILGNCGWRLDRLSFYNCSFVMPGLSRPTLMVRHITGR